MVHPVATGSSRLFYVDYLRVVLSILVVIHHVALVYGAYTPFYYVEPPFNRGMLVFGLVNQSWFMGAFFLIAGYVTPGSFDKKGAASFLKDKILRLGIPILIFFFVLGPISELGRYLMPTSRTGTTAGPGWQDYPRFLGLGPLWFAAMLLIFSIGYAAWRSLMRKQTSWPVNESTRLRYLPILVFIPALATASYLFRMAVPMGKEILGFPTLSYLAQYLSFYVLGAVAYRRGWFGHLSQSMGVVTECSSTISGTPTDPTLSSSRERLEVEHA